MIPKAKIFSIAVVLVALLPYAGAPKPGLADIAPERPAAGINNVWYVSRSKDAIIVFVHGILSDSRDAWSHEADDGTVVYWPELLRTDHSFNDYSIFLGGFHTGVDSRNFGMRDAAIELFERLNFRPKGGKSVLDHSKIVFVTHSTGGIVVRHMLVRQKPVFRTKKIGLLLFASPSLGSIYANLLIDVLDIDGHQMGRELKKNSGVLVELDKDFFNMVSNRELPGLIGREAFEHYFVLRSLRRFFPEVVPADSATRYFAEPMQLPNTDHFSIVKPHGVTHLAYIFLSNFVFSKFEPLPHPACTSPNPFYLRFSVVDDTDTARVNRFDFLRDGTPILNLRLDKPIRETRRRRLARQHDGSYEYNILLPCVGEEFKCQFTRLIFDSRLDKDHKPLVTDLCFKRKKLGLDMKFTHHECVEGGGCKPGALDPGIAQACGSNDQGFLRNLFISTAYARDLSDGVMQEMEWTVPSYETLLAMPRAARPGFTVFTLRSGPLPGLADADRFTTAIKVNGVPVLEDGWPAHSTSEPFDHREGLRYKFAMQNLGFSGAQDGKEIIEVSLRFFLRNIFVGEEVLSREYVALRNAELLHRKLKNGGFVQWTATYSAPVKPDKFEVFLTSTKNVKYVVGFKARFDKAELTFDKQLLVAVIRPPLPPNKYFVVAAGLVLESGQTRFTFDKRTASDLCQELYSKRKVGRFQTLIQDDIHLFENQPRAPGAPKIRFCKDLQ